MRPDVKVESTIRVSSEFEAPPGLAAVGVFERIDAANEAGLAVLAMGEAYWTLLDGERYVLCVEGRALGPVRAELAAMARLGGARRRPAPKGDEDFSFGGISFLVYGLLLVGFFGLQQSAAWTERGINDSVAVFQSGEIWRTVTALTLHADLLHLVSNLVAGTGFGLLVARCFGAGPGWLLILCSGTAGNLLNAWVHFPEVHRSLGASTAVFGALGLLTGFGIHGAMRAPARRFSVPAWAVPALGGMTLLGLLGMGDIRVDVAAHLSGFLCGGLLGWVATAGRAVLRGRRWLHRCAAAAALGLPFLAWIPCLP